LIRHPVFFDPSRKRAAVLGAIGGIAAIVSTIVLVAFVASVLILPNVTGLAIPPPHHRTPLAVVDEIAQRRELLPASSQPTREIAEQRLSPP
jgi:hypothetical protein